MKKWSRIGICLVLTVCLLLLPACKDGQTPNTGDTGQSTGQTEEDVVQQNPSSEDNSETSSVPLVWKANSVNT